MELGGGIFNSLELDIEGLDNCKKHLSLILEARGILDTDKIEKLTEKFKSDDAADFDEWWNMCAITCCASLASNAPKLPKRKENLILEETKFFFG